MRIPMPIPALVQPASGSAHVAPAAGKRSVQAGGRLLVRGERLRTGARKNPREDATEDSSESPPEGDNPSNNAAGQEREPVGSRR